MPLTTDQGRTPSDIGLFFGFEYSPAFPGKKGDTSGSRALAKLLPHISGTVTPVVISKSSPWLREVSEVDGIYLEKMYTETEFAFDDRSFVDYELFLSVLAEVEALALRRKELLWSGKARLRSYLESKIRFWFHIFDGYRVHYYVSGNVPHRIDDYIAYRLAKAKDIPRLCFYRLPIVPGVMSRLILYRDIGEQRFPGLVQELGVKELQSSVVDNQEGPNEGKPLSEDLETIYKACVLEGSKLTDLSAQVMDAKGLKEYESAACKNPEPVTVPENPAQTVRQSGSSKVFPKLWRRACEMVVSILERWEFWHYSEDVRAIAEKEDYFLLMLHYQPEASSRPLGGLWANQMHLVKTLAKALPRGMKLYVKEHPKQKYRPSYRGYGFYKSISKLNGVRLISTSSGMSLFESSKGVITLTGAVAFEALLQGKPAIVMGDSVLSRCRGVYSPNSFSELCEELELIAEAEHPGASKLDVRQFFEWLDDYSFKGYLGPYVAPEIDYFWSEEDNIQRLTTLMYRWFCTWGPGAYSEF